jgi:hypothetical protein
MSFPVSMKAIDVPAKGGENHGVTLLTGVVQEHGGRTPKRMIPVPIQEQESLNYPNVWKVGNGEAAWTLGKMLLVTVIPSGGRATIGHQAGDTGA